MLVWENMQSHLLTWTVYCSICRLSPVVDSILIIKTNHHRTMPQTNLFYGCVTTECVARFCASMHIKAFDASFSPPPPCAAFMRLCKWFQENAVYCNDWPPYCHHDIIFPANEMSELHLVVRIQCGCARHLLNSMGYMWWFSCALTCSVWIFTQNNY